MKKFLYMGDHAETQEGTGKTIVPWEPYEEDPPSETTKRWIAEGKARAVDAIDDADTNAAEVEAAAKQAEKKSKKNEGSKG